MHLLGFCPKNLRLLPDLRDPAYGRCDRASLVSCEPPKHFATKNGENGEHNINIYHILSFLKLGSFFRMQMVFCVHLMSFHSFMAPEAQR